MIKIDSSKLTGANTYFTDFENRILTTDRNGQGFLKNIERSLKILLLTKNNIICPVSSLTSEFAYNFFKNNPVLLRQSLVIPAFESDKNSYIDIFSSVRIPQNLKKEMISFYNENTNIAIKSEVKSDSGWFFESFLNSVKNKGSIINARISDLSEEITDLSIIKLENYKVHDLKTIDNFSKNVSVNLTPTLNNYSEQLSHMSGARSLNCESSRYYKYFIDYSLPNLKKNKTFLSGIQIFWKLFIEIIYEMLNKPKIPVDLIDKLTFEDILYLKQPILNNEFINDYNQLYYKSVFSLLDNNSNNILHNVEELLMFKHRLEFYFDEIFTKELEHYFMKNTVINSNGFFKNTIKYGIGVIPLNNIVSGGTGIFTELKAAYFNISQNFNNANSVNTYDNNLEKAVILLVDMVRGFNSDNKLTLFEIFDSIFNSITYKVLV